MQTLIRLIKKKKLDIYKEKVKTDSGAGDGGGDNSGGGNGAAATTFHEYNTFGQKERQRWIR